MKEIIQRVCLLNNEQRAEALKSELAVQNVHFECREDMAVVVPSAEDDAVVLCAHFDAVPGSFGYNDNGMSLAIILSLMKRLPEIAEVVFTNGEECGFLGARYYLKHSRKRILGCVNLDVCGFGNMIYCDRMNSALELPGCKTGRMPLNDGCIFAANGIPALTFSTGPAEVPFAEGIRQIGRTIHNGPLDNQLEVLNFELPDSVGSFVLRAIEAFANAA